MSKLTEIVNNIISVINNTVRKTGDQTIAGVKTFSSSPIVPTPTDDMQVSTKKYVDDLGALKASLSSPAFTDTPTAPTASSGTNNDQVATTAFAQPRLVSGTNIKTINGTSLLGSGDISVSPTTADVGIATSGLSAGAIGSYTFAYRSSGSDNIGFDSIVSGSILKPCSALLSASDGAFLTATGPVLSGAWRCMGYLDTISASGNIGTTLWLRIS